MLTAFSNLWKAIQTDKPVFRFVLCTVFVFIMIFTIENINDRFWLADFNVYYHAAKAMYTGETVYFNHFNNGQGYYKYSPVVLFFFLPYSIFSYKIAAIIHFIILSLVIGYTFIIIRRIFTRYLLAGETKNEDILLSFSFFCVLIHVVKELHLGNINCVLLLLCCLCLWNFQMRRSFSGGILLAIIILTKPFYIILVLPLLLRRNWRSLVAMVLTLLTGVILPTLILGPTRSWSLHLDWLKTMFHHYENYPGVNTVFYLLQKFLFPGLPGFVEFLLLLLVLVAFAWLILKNIQVEGKSGDPSRTASANIILEWFMLIAIIPNLVNTDSEHFLATLPLITYIIYYIHRKRVYWLIPVMVILIFFYGANSMDLLGKELSNKLFKMGMIGLSNLGLLLITLILFLEQRKKDKLLVDY